MQGLPRRTEEDELTFGGLTEQRLVEELADRLRRDGVGVTGAGEATRRRVAHEHLAVATHDHHPVGHGLQRRGQPIAIDAQAFRVGFELGHHRVDASTAERPVVVVRLRQRGDPSFEPPHASEHHDGAVRPRRRESRPTASSRTCHPNLPVM